MQLDVTRDVTKYLKTAALEPAAPNIDDPSYGRPRQPVTVRAVVNTAAKESTEKEQYVMDRRVAG